jgi:hypothetical protein
MVKTSSGAVGHEIVDSASMVVRAARRRARLRVAVEDVLADVEIERRKVVGGEIEHELNTA